jgi:hypothetical protein
MTPRQTARRLVSEVFYSKSHRYIGDRASASGRVFLPVAVFGGQSCPPKETKNNV